MLIPKSLHREVGGHVVCLRSRRQGHHPRNAHVPLLIVQQQPIPLVTVNSTMDGGGFEATLL